MPSYRRQRINGAVYFFTVNLLERKKSLLTDHIELLRELGRKVKNRKPFYIDGSVILPDYMQRIWTLPLEDSDYSRRWREIKKGFSETLSNSSRLSPVRIQ